MSRLMILAFLAVHAFGLTVAAAAECKHSAASSFLI